MGHGHAHDHDHEHAGDVPTAMDLSVPDSELSPADVSRRGFLRGAGLLGAGAAASVLATPPDPALAAGREPAGGSITRGGFQWLAGDHNMLRTPSGEVCSGHARKYLRPASPPSR